MEGVSGGLGPESKVGGGVEMEASKSCVCGEETTSSDLGETD
jgi:hypothetical protein